MAKFAVPVKMYINEMEVCIMRSSRKSSMIGLSMQIEIQEITAHPNPGLSFPVAREESMAKTNVKAPRHTIDHSK
jgi:hypothetical protein